MSGQRDGVRARVLSVRLQRPTDARVDLMLRTDAQPISARDRGLPATQTVLPSTARPHLGRDRWSNLARHARAPGSMRRCAPMATKVLALRWPDTCVSCKSALAARTDAWWDSATGAVTCLRCGEVVVARPTEPQTPEPLDSGLPGASLDREHERRRSRREERARAAHPHIGDFLLWLRDAPQHEAAFDQGANAERAVARSLHERTAKSGVILLHNRLMPKRRGDIDHIAIAPSGVWVIDTKSWHGEVRIKNPLFGSPKLLVSGRDRTSAIDGLDRQLDAVRAALTAADNPHVTFQGALCFTDANLPGLRTQHMRGHQLLYRKPLAKQLNKAGSLDEQSVLHIAQMLHNAFPPA